MRLGAVLAGGRSSRFGSDKALALHAGFPLLDHALAALRPHVDALLVCGRSWPGVASVADRPAADLGPLGGIAAALTYAHANGFVEVLTLGCDTPSLPAEALAALEWAGAPAVLATLPVIALWPSALASRLDAHLASSPDRSIRRWARGAGASFVGSDAAPPNVNTPADLTALR